MTRRRLTHLLFALICFCLAPAAHAEERKPVRAGFVYLTTTGDNGWTRSHDNARRMAEEVLGDGVETRYVENVPEGPDAARVLRSLADAGMDIIFTTSFGYMDPTLEVAREYPHIKFEHLTGYKRSANVATANIRFHEARYVQGVVAGLMTRTGRIGYIGAFPIAEVLMGINAFARGLATTNPDARISVIWANTWYDPVREAEIARVHIAHDADILAAHLDSPAMLQAAGKAGVMGFGQAIDMAGFAPRAHLLSTVNNWGPYYTARIAAVQDGTWESGDTWGGFESGMLELAGLDALPPGVREAAIAARDAIASGALDIFAGPLRDNNGREIIGAGETLDDAALWEMDYYIEGVLGKPPL